MPGIENIIASLSGPVGQALGIALLHSLWQGLLVAALLYLMLRLLEGGSSHLRYIISCVALILMLVGPSSHSWNWPAKGQR